MNRSMLRTLQSGAALVVLTVLTVAVLRVVGVFDTERALSIGIKVSSTIGLCMLAGVALIAVFGFGRDHES